MAGKKPTVASLFAGAGGLDLGFSSAGFEVVYANEYDSAIWETYEKNHGIKVDRRSIVDVPSSEIPNVDGIIGGPPCQSWSLAGAMRGAKDERGKLFYEYIRILKDKKPKFFVAENVPGIISKTHLPSFLRILKEFSECGYEVNYKLLDARDYGVPQERKRVVVVGLRKDLGKKFEFPAATYLGKHVNLKQAIGDLPPAKAASEKNKANGALSVPNHEYMNGGFSTIYMSRNRRKNWADCSFTIQAGGRHAPLHPSSCLMEKVGPDEWRFTREKQRRMSIRECARIQTFPDDFVFFYDSVANGYKMVGNAVPVKLAEAVAIYVMKYI